MLREPLAAEVLLGQVVGVEQRTHRAVEDHDPPTRISSSRQSVACVPFVAIMDPEEKRRVKSLADCRKAKRGLIIVWNSFFGQARPDRVGSTAASGMLLF